jgi:hypothetical protein
VLPPHIHHSLGDGIVFVVQFVRNSAFKLLQPGIAFSVETGFPVVEQAPTHPRRSACLRDTSCLFPGLEQQLALLGRAETKVGMSWAHVPILPNFVGLFKVQLTNTDIAILVYYSNGDIFNYQAHYQRGKKVDRIADGQFRVQELPIFFKVRIDSDLPLPYAKKPQGYTLYLNQQPKPGLFITSMVN